MIQSMQQGFIRCDPKLSEIKFERCDIFHNSRSAMYFERSSRVEIRGSNVYKNGNGVANYPQINIENSFVYVSDSQIYDARKGSGIYCKGSRTELFIEKVRTYGNSVGLRCMGYKKLEIDNSSYFYDGIK